MGNGKEAVRESRSFRGDCLRKSGLCLRSSRLIHPLGPLDGSERLEALWAVTINTGRWVRSSATARKAVRSRARPGIDGGSRTDNFFVARLVHAQTWSSAGLHRGRIGQGQGGDRDDRRWGRESTRVGALALRGRRSFDNALHRSASSSSNGVSGERTLQRLARCIRCHTIESVGALELRRP